MCQSTDGCLICKINRFFSFNDAGQVKTSQQTAWCRFQVPFNSGNLTGKKDIGIVFQSVELIEQLRWMDVGISMHYSVSYKISLFQPGNQWKNTFLLPKFQVGLKADKIIEGAPGIILTQLDYGIRFFPRSGIRQTYRLQRSESNGILTSACHDFYGHAALKDSAVFKLINLSSLSMYKFMIKDQILVPGQGAIYIIILSPSITGSTIDFFQVKWFIGNNRGSCIIKI